MCVCVGVYQIIREAERAREKAIQRLLNDDRPLQKGVTLAAH